MKELVRRNCQIDFAQLQGILPYGIVPCDIDGVIEINGNFLFIETKFGPIDMPRGQKLMYEHLSRMPNTTVVLVAVNEKQTSIGLYHFDPTHWKFIIDGNHTEWTECDYDKFVDFYKKWYDEMRKYR